MPGVFNAANEVAVEAFLEERISFPKIWQMVESVMQAHRTDPNPNLESIIAADQWARAEARKSLGLAQKTS